MPAEQHELERRVGDRKVGVALADLGRLGLEQLGVELDRSIEVGDVEGELDTRHVISSRSDVNNILTFVDVVKVSNRSTNVNVSDEVFGTVRVMAASKTAVLDPIACCAPVRADVLDEAQAELLADSFAALADPIRLRLLSYIAASGEDEVCACDLVEPSGRSQPTVSHHMKILVDAGLDRA